MFFMIHHCVGTRVWVSGEAKTYENPLGGTYNGVGQNCFELINSEGNVSLFFPHLHKIVEWLYLLLRFVCLYVSVYLSVRM